MLRLTPPQPRRFAWAVALLLVPALASAQTLPNDGPKTMKDQWNDRTVRDTAAKLTKGQVKPGKDNQDTIDLMAKLYTYRLTWDETATPDAVRKLWNELESDLNFATKSKPESQEFLNEFSKKAAAYGKEVLATDKLLARVNAARVLARLAQAGQEEVADVLADAAKNPETDDGARYWAFVGLKELFAPAHQVPPAPMKDKAREERCILALLEYLERKPVVSGSATPEEIEGQRVLRREAVRALALTRYPAVVQNKEIKGRTALVLLRVARSDGFNPETRWDERVEAAIGLARMQSKLNEDYQPDYAAYHLGAVLVEFGTLYNELNQKNPPVEKGWKVYAARLNEALAAMKADVGKNVKDKQVVQYVNDLISRGSDLLKLIETRANRTDAATFGEWLANNPPKSAEVYKGVTDARIKPAEPAEK